MIILNEEQRIALSDYKFIDLFCGIGGFHLALSSFGARCVFASDIDAEARSVYENNFRLEPMGDITSIEAENIPEHEILCGGFPCQAFSVSGSQEGFNHATGKLFYEIIRIARHKQPKLILLENVANLERHNKGATLAEICDQLRDIGYTPSYKILNAADFNIPQCRRRIYIVAFRNDVFNSEIKFPNTMPLIRRLVDLLDNDDFNAVELAQIHRDYHLRDELAMIEQGNGHYLRIGEIGLGRQGERIYSVQGCAVTLSSSSGGLGGRTGMYLINNTIRKLTPRECARLMGFPEKFILAETTNMAYRQFGNSVVVDVLQKIIIEVIPHLVREN